MQLPLALLVSRAVDLTGPAQKHPRRFVALIINFTAALISAAVAFSLLNRRPPSPSQPPNPPSPVTHLDVINPGPFDEPPELGSRDVDHVTLDANSSSRTELAGKTMDLTLFAAIRACDVLISHFWRRIPNTRSKRVASLTTSTTLFCSSVATIMHAWFYTPSRLPHTYNKWISAAAELDNRLLLALRHARYGAYSFKTLLHVES